MNRWLAYTEVEPWGPIREDMRAARLVQWIAAQKGANLDPGDVFATLQETPVIVEETPEEHEAYRQSMARGARDMGEG